MAASLLLSGADIGRVLTDTGPVVKCVLLRHMLPDGKDTKPHPTALAAHAMADHHQQSGSSRPVLTELIQEISVDTTPSKNQIAAVLGGPFTFVGQFPTEGTVVMARRELEDETELAELSVHELRRLCSDWNVDTSNMLEKNDLVQALQEAAPELPVNPHRLQPPLDGIVVRGDLLLLRVAETEEELDQEEGEGDDSGDGDDLVDKSNGEKKQLMPLSNEEFFLDYTKEEYIAFAGRTDVVAPPIPDGVQDEDSEEAEEAEDADDQEFQFGEDGEGVSDDDKGAILNLILGEVIKQFREDNGRGPNTHELLDLRSQVAEKLGVEVASFEQVNTNAAGAKRPADDDEASSPMSTKRVQFINPSSDDVTTLALKPDSDEDEKPPAKNGEENGDRKEAEEES